MHLEPSRTTLYYMDSPASPHRRGLFASALLVAALTGCGTGSRTIQPDLDTPLPWVTVEDPLTGVAYRCLFFDGDYALNSLCYRMEEQ